MVLPTVTREELRLISDVRVDSETGYWCVYPRNRKYVGKCFKRPAGPLRATAREAAEDVVRWWKRMYGAEWYQFFLSRRAPGWQLIRDGKGWRIKVFILGQSVPIGGGQIGKVYRCPDDATAAMKHWIKSTFGLFAPKSHLFLRRKARHRFPATPHTADTQLVR